jgi:cellulose synthase/poly-beta-1,6-N-acetylglucosamine synthase-like glycosyltransferase
MATAASRPPLPQDAGARQMMIYGWFVLAFFGAFVAVHTALLVLGAQELHHYTGGRSAGGLRRIKRSPLAPGITIVVPAYNEEAGIADSVRSLLALDYPQIEIVVVNDGSADGTMARLIEAFDLRPAIRPPPPFLTHQPVRGVYLPRSRLRLLVLDKANGGKADALNAGINFATYPLVCSVDADSILEQDALAMTALPFIEDPRRTVAVGGMVRVANGCRIERGRVVDAHLPRSGFAMFQVMEYLRALFGTRTGWSAINGLLIISGAFGLFRRDAVIAAGGYRTDTVGEDMELVVRLHRICRDRGRPYRIMYITDPVCWTEAPERARYLRRQRSRWHRGCLEALLFHKRMLFNPRYRAAGMLTLPAMLIFEILGPLIELSGYVVLAAMLATGTVSVATFALFIVLAVLYGLVLTLGAAALEDATENRHPAWADLRRILLYAVLENFGYRQLMHLWRLEGFWRFFRKTGWGAMERKGLSNTEAGAPTSRAA